MAAAEAAGLEVREVRTAWCRMEFFDVERHAEVLRRIDAEIRSTGPLVAHSIRHRAR
ncbi:hypothetical protein [Pseudonocardia xishanensis]|uniref:Uncharacterized protein n=1 Tax=Pseudonocardia xishanensis TaxID=630995 RepID=A0ABP8RNU9_9PSEU